MADNTFGDALIGALEEAIAYERGELPGTRVERRAISARDANVLPPPAYSPEQVRRIRDEIGISQQVFADLLNASASAVRAWERGARAPDGPTRRLLQIAELRPEVMTTILEGNPSPRNGQTLAPGIMAAETRVSYVER